MLLFIIAVVLIVVGIVLMRKSVSDSLFEMVGIISMGVGSAVITTLLLLLPLCRLDIRQKIKGFESTRETIATQREKGVGLEVENATLIIKMIECNKWLRETQYRNNIMFDIFIPDEIDTLEPLK